MTQSETPAWLDGWEPAEPKPKAVKARGGNPTWTPGMKSPNPAGRPRGIVDKRAKIAQRMLADADGIVAALVEKALEGDTGAASLILGRVLPALRSQTEKVCFPFSAHSPVSEQVAAVLNATAAGAVSADVARTLIDSIKALADVRAVEELEQRIITLEARTT